MLRPRLFSLSRTLLNSRVKDETERAEPVRHHSASCATSIKGLICDRQDQMTTLALELDERELSTIQAALLLLQEQIDALPEDLSEMLSQHGLPLTETEIERLADRIAMRQVPSASRSEADLTPSRTLVEVEPVGVPALLLKQHC